MFAALLLKFWKQLAVMLLCLACFALGKYSNHAPASVSTTTETKTQENQQTASQEDKQKDTQAEKQTHVKTVTVKAPDGTVTTTTTADSDTKVNTELKDDKTASSSDTKSSDTTTKTTTTYAPATSYKLGLYGQLDDILTPWANKPTYGVSVGYRALGPVWLDGTYNWEKKQATLGFSLEF